MVIQFITVEMALVHHGLDLKSAIEAELRTQGEPLRWAITSVHQGVAHIEAVVIQECMGSALSTVLV